MQTHSELVLPFVPAEIEGARDELIYGPQSSSSNSSLKAQGGADVTTAAAASAAAAAEGGDRSIAGTDSAKEEEEDNQTSVAASGARARQAAQKSNVPPAHQSSVWATADLPVALSDRLSNFYRKYNKTLLDNIAIDKEKQRLLQENAQLEDLIQQFLNGTKISDLTFAEDNPVMVINGRANLNYVPNPSSVGPTVQEGNVIVLNAAAQSAAYAR
jgi:hypothetical protein